jgi:signal peptidase I
VFRNPDIPIRFLPDCLYNTTVDIWVNESLDPPPPPYLRFYYPGHKLRMGDRIFVQGFKSGNVELDTYVNRPEGLVASGDPSSPKINPGVLITKREVVVDEDTGITIVRYVEDGYFWTDPAINLFNVKFPGIVPEVPEDPGPPVVLPAIPAHPGLVSFIATQTVTVCVANRRMRIPMRIRRVVDRVTNHITP